MTRIKLAFKDGTSPRLWGDSQKSSSTRGNVTVHPHACGEIRPPQCQKCPAIGTSPRLWEIHRYLKGHSINAGTSPRLWGDSTAWPPSFREYRYIPTPVGRLIPSDGKSMDAPVHPHACGEIHKGIIGIDRMPGTSPRLWGDLYPDCYPTPFPRYIPTPVGRLTPGFPCDQEGTVHPHACGEILAAGWQIARQAGTSPRLWGDCFPNRVLSP